MRRAPDLTLEATWWLEGYRLVAGVDEVGRGALFGPVVAAAVVLPSGWQASAIPGLCDSKLATPAKREELYDSIVAAAQELCVGIVSAAEIDALGISRATLKAMQLALDGLAEPAEMVIVDGIGPLPQGYRVCAAIDADALCSTVAAASIVAKVRRDRLVCELARDYPGYRLEENKGYATPEHLEALRLLGPTPLHRRSFAPVLASTD